MKLKRALAAALLVVAAIGALVSEAPAEPESAATSDSQEKLEVYGNTPEALRPYGRFVRRPYKLFFVEPLEFTGPGREKPEPEVETVKIGVLAPFERSHEGYIGRPILWGSQVAVDEANEQGGYRGIPFELVIRNDTGLWGASANEVVAFSYEDSCWAVIGTVDGANTHIAIRVALKTELPMMNVGDTDPTLVETKIPWVFRNIADDRQMAYTLAYYVYKEMNHQRVAILRADNRYGRFGVGEFRSSSERLGLPAPIEINYEVAYNHVNPDFAVQLERLERVAPDAVILWADAEPAGRLLKRMREAGLDMPVYACDRVVHADFLGLAGEAADGVVAAYPYDPEADIPELKAFKSTYRQRFGNEPTVYATHAYDGAWMVIEAIREAGLNRYRIRDALAAIEKYQCITGEITMDDVYSDRGPVTLTTVRSGQFVYNEPRVLVRF